MNRTLRRPMFRMGGSAEGITSGLAPRQGYDKGNIVEKIQSQKSIIDALAPRQPRQDRSMSNFLIDFGLDIASRSPSGSIFSTAAASAKDPFAKFQQAKQMQDAYAMSETSEDRALIASLIKGMDEDKLSALMKDVKAGVEAGEFANEAEGIKLLLQKKIYGVLDMPGEVKGDRIRELELMISRDQEVPAGMVKSVAEHIYNIESGVYPEEVQKDLNKTKTYIKPNHIKGMKKDAEGEVSEIVLDTIYDKTYTTGQIYFDAQTGNLFKKVSKEGEAPLFVRVDYKTN
jgi:hypothetical protein